MDAERAGLATSVTEGERVVDRHFRALAKECGGIVRDVAGDGPVRAEHYGAIMARIDRSLARLYPVTPGGESLLESEIVRVANRGRIRGVRAGMQPFRGALRADRAIREALDDGRAQS